MCENRTPAGRDRRIVGSVRLPLSADVATASASELLERAGRRGHHALAAAVVAGDEPAFAAWAAAGPAPDERSLFEIGSVTKVFTGVLLADMHLRGEVDLQDPLSRHLADPGPVWGERAPTLLELATHRSGLPNSPRAMRRAELLFVMGFGDRDPWAGVDARRYHELLRASSPRPPRGRRIAYSSVGFGLLGDALAAAAGRRYEELVRERVLAPLGMHATAIRPDAPALQGHSARGRPRPPLDDPMEAAGSLRSNTAEMALFLAACLRPGDEPPGPALALAQRPAHVMGSRMSIGLGWMITTPRGSAPIVWHNGGTWGFASVAGFSPQTGRGAVVLANTARAVTRVGRKLLEQG